MNPEETTGAPGPLQLPGEMRQLVLHRLRRLEGQTRGVQRMVLEERDCREVLQQIAAIQAAARSLGALVLEHYLLACLQESRPDIDADEPWIAVREAIRGFTR
ncbi:MAG: metal-sensitive transcriptional regulator [Chloroflexia bacterium]